MPTLAALTAPPAPCGSPWGWCSRQSRWRMSLATPSPSPGAPTLAPPSVALCSAGIHVDEVRPVGAALAPSPVAVAARASAAGNASKHGSKAGRSPASCNKHTQSQIALIKLRRNPMKHTTSFCPTDMNFPYVKNEYAFRLLSAVPRWNFAKVGQPVWTCFVFDVSLLCVTNTSEIETDLPHIEYINVFPLYPMMDCNHWCRLLQASRFTVLERCSHFFRENTSRTENDSI